MLDSRTSPSPHLPTMSDPFAYSSGPSSGHGTAPGARTRPAYEAAPPPEWSTWGAPPAGGLPSMPPTGSMGTMSGGPASRGGAAPRAAAGQPFAAQGSAYAQSGQAQHYGQAQAQHYGQAQHFAPAAAPPAMHGFGGGPSTMGGMGSGAFNPAALAEMTNNPMAQLGIKYGSDMVQTSLQRYMPGACSGEGGEKAKHVACCSVGTGCNGSIA